MLRPKKDVEYNKKWWDTAQEVLKPRVQLKNHIHSLAMLNHFKAGTAFVKLETGHCYECGMTTSHAPDCKIVYEPLHVDRVGIMLIEGGIRERFAKKT